MCADGAESMHHFSRGVQSKAGASELPARSKVAVGLNEAGHCLHQTVAVKAMTFKPVGHAGSMQLAASTMLACAPAGRRRRGGQGRALRELRDQARRVLWMRPTPRASRRRSAAGACAAAWRGTRTTPPWARASAGRHVVVLQVPIHPSERELPGRQNRGRDGSVASQSCGAPRQRR